MTWIMCRLFQRGWKGQGVAEGGGQLKEFLTTIFHPETLGESYQNLYRWWFTQEIFGIFTPNFGEDEANFD